MAGSQRHNHFACQALRRRKPRERHGFFVMDISIKRPRDRPHASREAIVRVTQEAGRLDDASVLVLEWLLMCYSKVWGGYECMVTRPDATLDTAVRQCSLLSAGLTFSTPML
jgi:hypothetical protein